MLGANLGLLLYGEVSVMLMLSLDITFNVVLIGTSNVCLFVDFNDCNIFFVTVKWDIFVLTKYLQFQNLSLKCFQQELWTMFWFRAWSWFDFFSN